MTEAQKNIIASFPAKDRGIYDANDKAAAVVEEDPLEAVVKKIKIRKHEKKVNAGGDEAKAKKVRFAGDEEDSDDYIEDSEEDYDEEEYDEEYDEEEEKEGEGVEDANKVSEKVQQFKPAAGVKFAQYDEYGLPKDDGFDYKQFIVTDEMRPTDLYIEAPPEMLEKMMIKAGINKDIDKDVKHMNEEGMVYVVMIIFVRKGSVQLFGRRLRRVRGVGG